MSAFSWPCQVALRAALLSTAECDGRVYDMPPQADSIFPYVQIGDSDITPDDSGSSTVAGQSDDGVIEDIDIHVWGRDHAGKKDVKEIADAIHDRLHGVDLAIVGRASSLTWVRRIHVAIEPDGVTTRAIVSIQVIHRS